MAIPLESIPREASTEELTLYVLICLGLWIAYLAARSWFNTHAD